MSVSAILFSEVVSLELSWTSAESIYIDMYTRIHTGASMCKFPYSILIIYSVILLNIIEYYRYITDVIVMT